MTAHGGSPPASGPWALAGDLAVPAPGHCALAALLQLAVGATQAQRSAAKAGVGMPLS